MDGESIKNILPGKKPQPKTQEIAEKMLAGVESTEGITERAQNALVQVVDALRQNPEKIASFTKSLEGFGNSLTVRNDQAKESQEKMLSQINMVLPDAHLEGTSVDVRIGALVAKLAEGIKAGTIGLDDVEIMFNLARLEDQESRAKAQAIDATSQGAVSRDALPEKQESKQL